MFKPKLSIIFVASEPPRIALWCGNNEIEQGLVSDKGWNEHSMSWEDYLRSLMKSYRHYR